mmetsp:Transcript_26449/g.62558  ORF Transcript_26449/g.62558 Transcript_26449/m.62558 type:complete len:236 (+) Transcript_26449:225-932(+)
MFTDPNMDRGAPAGSTIQEPSEPGPRGWGSACAPTAEPAPSWPPSCLTISTLTPGVPSSPPPPCCCCCCCCCCWSEAASHICWMNASACACFWSAVPASAAGFLKRFELESAFMSAAPGGTGTGCTRSGPWLWRCFWSAIWSLPALLSAAWPPLACCICCSSATPACCDAGPPPPKSSAGSAKVWLPEDLIPGPPPPCACVCACCCCCCISTCCSSCCEAEAMMLGVAVGTNIAP